MDTWQILSWVSPLMEGWREFRELSSVLYMQEDPKGHGTEHTLMKEENRETNHQISYNTAYVWHLEKWSRWIYLQSGNRDTDVENKPSEYQGGKGGKENWKTGIDIYTLLIYV